MDLTAADIAQNKAINEMSKKVDRTVDQLVVMLAMLDKLEHAVEVLAPVIKVVQNVEKVVDRVEQAVSRLESL